MKNLKKVDVVRLLQNGAVTLPLSLRRKMKLRKGTQFTVIGINDTIILKKMEEPAYEGQPKKSV